MFVLNISLNVPSSLAKLLWDKGYSNYQIELLFKSYLEWVVQFDDLNLYPKFLEWLEDVDVKELEENEK